MSVAYSNAGTVISGGAGDDRIRANGEIGGGPGNDWISPFKLHTSGLRVTGGRGHDVIVGTKLRDTVDPGPGNDVIDLEGASRYGGEHIDTRDGETDYLFCYRQDRADIDQFDEYPDDFCRHVRRQGGPARAIPDREPFHDGAYGPELWLSCPADGPLECSGDVTVTRRGAVVFREDFRTERYRRSNATVELPFRAGRRKLRGYEGDVRITVRSHDRAGRLRTAARTYDYPDGPYRDLRGAAGLGGFSRQQCRLERRRALRGGRQVVRVRPCHRRV